MEKMPPEDALSQSIQKLLDKQQELAVQLGELLMTEGQEATAETVAKSLKSMERALQVMQDAQRTALLVQQQQRQTLLERARLFQVPIIGTGGSPRLPDARPLQHGLESGLLLQREARGEPTRPGSEQLPPIGADLRHGDQHAELRTAESSRRWSNPRSSH